MLTDPALPAEPPGRANGARLEFPNPHGLPRFALRPESKEPLHREFWRDASPDTDIPPGHNAGVPAGRGLIVLDLDVKNGKDGRKTLAALQAIHDGLPPTYAVSTPSGGEHRYFRDPLGRDFGQGTDRLGSGVDLKAHPHRYVVAAGSRADGGVYEITDGREPAEAPQWLIAELLRTAPKARAPVDQVPLVELDTDEAIALATRWLREEAPESGAGERNDTAARRIAPRLKDFGLSRDRALELAAEHWNDSRVEPPLDADELETAIFSGYASATGSPPGIAIAQLPENEFPALSEDQIAEIEAKPRPVADTRTAPASAPAFRSFAPFTEDDEAAIPCLDFVYGNHYARGYVTQTTAPPKVGKSLLTLAELVDAASGQGFLKGRPRPPCRALYINFEDDMRELRSRRAAIRALYEIPSAEIDGRLGLVSGVDQPDFYLVKSDGTINEPAFRHLESEITRHCYDLVVLDPLQDASHAEESNEVFRLLGKRLRETASKLNVAIGIVHHTRKMAPGQTNMTMDDARGGGALRGSCRFNRLLVPMSKEEAGKARAQDPRVQDHRYFFRIGQIEGNMAPPSSELNRWFEKVSVQIANEAEVAAVRRWTWPESLEGVTGEMAVAVREALAAKPRREDVRSPEWAGYLVAEVCGFPFVGKASEEELKKARAKAIVATWLRDGVLVKEAGRDRHGTEKPFLVPGGTDPLNEAPEGEA